MSREVIGMSDRFLVTSRAAARLAQLEAGPDLAPRVGVVGFATEIPRRTGCRTRLRSVSAREGAWSQASGSSTRSKQPDKLLRAFACLAGNLPELLLALVGPVSARLADELGALGASLGLDGRVFVTGRVTAEAYLGWLNRAELSVQLRASFSGEASAAVGDCLAAGVPMIVSDLGWMEELQTTSHTRSVSMRARLSWRRRCALSSMTAAPERLSRHRPAATAPRTASPPPPVPSSVSSTTQRSSLQSRSGRMLRRRRAGRDGRPWQNATATASCQQQPAPRRARSAGLREPSGTPDGRVRLGHGDPGRGELIPAGEMRSVRRTKRPALAAGRAFGLGRARPRSTRRLARRSCRRRRAGDRWRRAERGPAAPSSEGGDGTWPLSIVAQHDPLGPAPDTIEAGTSRTTGIWSRVSGELHLLHPAEDERTRQSTGPFEASRPCPHRQAGWSWTHDRLILGTMPEAPGTPGGPCSEVAMGSRRRLLAADSPLTGCPVGESRATRLSTLRAGFFRRRKRSHHQDLHRRRQTRGPVGSS